MSQDDAPQNLLHAEVASLPEELVEILAESEHVRIERIVSTGHASPADFWYDQDETEWVCVLSGAATLSFADNDRLHHLGPGDHVTIPAHRRHRVERTSPDEPIVWLAVFWT